MKTSRHLARNSPQRFPVLLHEGPEWSLVWGLLEEFKRPMSCRYRSMRRIRSRGRHGWASYTTTLDKEVRMKQVVGMMALAIGLVLVLNGPAWSDQKGKGKKDEVK